MLEIAFIWSIELKYMLFKLLFLFHLHLLLAFTDQLSLTLHYHGPPPTASIQLPSDRTRLALTNCLGRTFRCE